MSTVKANTIENVAGTVSVLVEDIMTKTNSPMGYKIVDFGTVVNNTRTVKDNPFGNDKWESCIAIAQVYDNGMWSGTGFISESYGYGTSANSNLEGIVVQTGDGSVLRTSFLTGSGHGMHATVTSAPCRVIVYYMGEEIV